MHMRYIDTMKTYPLIEAVKHEHYKAVELLLHNNANMYVYDELHQGPLHHAAMVGSLDICMLLLHYGVDINDPGHLGNTAIQYAYATHNIEMCKFLLERGANPNAVSRIGIRLADPKQLPVELKRLMIGYGADGRVGSAIWYDMLSN
jgi:ankyrin repeat protein